MSWWENNKNTEGVHRPPLSQKAPASIACRVFFGQKPALYCQKTPLFYPNTEGTKNHKRLIINPIIKRLFIKKSQNKEEV
jgi:hypothetical protein